VGRKPNSKSEARNSKQIQILKIRMFKTPVRALFSNARFVFIQFWSFVLWICFGFGISKFGFQVVGWVKRTIQTNLETPEGHGHWFPAMNDRTASADPPETAFHDNANASNRKPLRLCSTPSRIVHLHVSHQTHIEPFLARCGRFKNGRRNPVGRRSVFSGPHSAGSQHLGGGFHYTCRMPK